MSKNIGEQVTTQQGFSGTKREAKRLSKEFNWNLLSFDLFLRERGWNSKPGRWKAIIKDIAGEYTEDNILVGTEDDICNAASEITRRCKKCNTVKKGTEFAMDRMPQAPGSVCRKRVCKSCITKAVAMKDKSEVARKAKEYRQSFEGLKKDIYHHMQCTSRDRKWDEIISKEDFLEWIDAPEYRTLYDLYKHSDFKTWYRPSVDRIDIDLPYIQGNIQLMTWKENNAKEATRKFVQRLSNGLKCVKCTDKATGEVTIFKTTGLAAKWGDVSGTTITRLCNGTTPNAPLMKLYDWEWCDEDGGKFVEIDPTVYKLSMDGGTILATYPNAGDAARAEGIGYKGINKCLKGTRPNYMGYKWVYKRNHDK